MKLPKVKVSRRRRAKVDLPAADKPTIADGIAPELLSGRVQGKKASAAEERFANEINKTAGIEAFEFRRHIFAPGFYRKELDGLIVTRGIAYAIEIDSAFTHRGKAESDRLHDAIVLKALEQEGYEVYPQVIRIDGESELSDEKITKTTVRKLLQ